VQMMLIVNLERKIRSNGGRKEVRGEEREGKRGGRRRERYATATARAT